VGAGSALDAPWQSARSLLLDHGRREAQLEGVMKHKIRPKVADAMRRIMTMFKANNKRRNLAARRLIECVERTRYGQVGIWQATDAGMRFNGPLHEDGEEGRDTGKRFDSVALAMVMARMGKQHPENKEIA
jgi:hypothetical protein